VDLAASDATCVAILRDACAGAGFFHVVNHGVEAALTRRVVAAGAAFFDKPLPDKRALVRGDMRISRGYEISPEHQVGLALLFCYLTHTRTHAHFSPFILQPNTVQLMTAGMVCVPCNQADVPRE
jgi:isopenicillin N synthase-like dioxygenase